MTDENKLQKAKSAPAKAERPEGREVTLPGPSVKERFAIGKGLRRRATRSAQGKWVPPAHRFDPIELLKKSDHGRLPELLPIRYARMRQSAFGFFRGAAAVMAADLATTPRTGLRVQACGDCHVSNFGGFGSPERRLIFDINDFDETLHAPWEWDVKRLATSVVLAGRQKGDGEHSYKKAVRVAVASYREHMHQYAKMRALEVWYSALDAKILISNAKTRKAREYWERIEKKAKLQTAEHVFPRMTKVVNGWPRIIDNPPLIYHPRQRIKQAQRVREMFRRYRLTLPEERRVIIDRYHIVDIAQKLWAWEA
jgi:hypothetical protein